MYLLFLLSHYIWIHNNKLIKLALSTELPSLSNPIKKQELVELLLQEQGGKQHNVPGRACIGMCDREAHQ